MEHSRNKQLVSFKLHAIRSSVIKSVAAHLFLTGYMIISLAHSVHAAHSLVNVTVNLKCQQE